MDTSATSQQSAMPRPLYRGEIHIWHAPLEQFAGEAQGLMLTLSPDEQDRADRFRFDKDRNRYAMSRGMLRNLLGEYLGVSPGRLQFHYGRYGKPYLPDPSSPSPIHFSVSHSCGLTLLAFSRDQEIGIDVECIRMDFDFEPIAKRFFSPAELSNLLSLPDAAKAAEFFRLWTRMEAYAKARGIGLSIFDGSGASSQCGEDSSSRNVFNLGEEMSSWRIHEFIPEPDYVASVASTIPALTLKHWKYFNTPAVDFPPREAFESPIE
jgi:4'-phosphopantetheinyl transferase